MRSFAGTDCADIAAARPVTINRTIERDVQPVERALPEQIVPDAHHCTSSRIAPKRG
jgi:hypothetical protein